MPETVFHGLFLADRVIRENNGKTGIIGIFNRFNIRDFASPVPPFFIYGSIGNIEGKHEFTFNLVRDQSPDVIISLGGEIKSASADTNIELVFPITGVIFPKPGSYTLTMSVDGLCVGSRIIQVESAKPATDQPGG